MLLPGRTLAAYLADFSQSLVPVTYPAAVSPRDNTVRIEARADVIIHPSLKVPASDVGKTATLIMYIYFPDFGFGIDIPPGQKILTSVTIFDLIPGEIDFTGLEGLTFHIYYGYVASPGAGLFYAGVVGTIVVAAPPPGPPNCAANTSRETCNATEGCTYQAFPTAACILDCGTFTTDTDCNNAYLGESCRWTTTPFGNLCKVATRPHIEP